MELRFRWFVYLSFFFGLLHGFIEVQGQKPYIPFRHFSSSDGLSQNQVLAIYQDKYGFMWFGTLEGLNRFDGYEFVTYHHSKHDSTSIIGNSVRALLEDSKGNLWVGTSEGLSLFDRTLNTFRSFSHRPDDSTTINIGMINDIIEDRKGNLWIGLATGHLEYYDVANNVFKHYWIHEGWSDINSLLIDKHENLWIGTHSGIVVMNHEKEFIHRFKYNFANPSSISNNIVNAIVKDSQGNIWIGTDRGVDKYDESSNSFTHVYRDHPKVVKALAIDDQERLWIGTENGGLDLFDIKDNKIYNYSQNPSDLRSISDNSIQSIYRDKNMNMWVGTVSKGFDFYDRFMKPFVVYQSLPGLTSSLSHNKVNAVTEQPGNGFWIATDGGGLCHFDERTNNFKSYMHNPEDPFSLPSNHLVDVLWDNDNACLWVASWGGGLSRFNPANGLFKNYNRTGNKDKDDLYKNLWRLYQDKHNNLFVGSVGNGLRIMNKKTEQFTDVAPWDGLPEENAVSILVDSKNTLWIGTWGSGLLRLEMPSRKRLPIPDGVTIRNISAIYEDSDSRIWFTGNTGMQCLDLKTDSVFSITVDDGLPESSINGFEQDKERNFWLSTNKGIVKYNIKNKQSILFTVDDGLPTNEFTNRLYKAKNGKMYFGSVNGLVVFEPDRIQLNPLIPNVLITDFKIFNKSVPVGGNDKILSKHISETDEIWLPAKYNFISFDFVAVSYTAPQRNQYLYKLEEFDADWIHTTKQRTATYTSLDPGDYVFKVKASNNDGIWNETEQTIIIHVLPPWWQTIWFRVLLVLSVGMFAVVFYKHRVRTIARHNKQLVALVEEKTKEISEQHELLADQNEVLLQRQEEIEAQNEELKQSQEEISAHRDMVWAQNKKLEEAQRIIEKQNEEILHRNENLELEVEMRTKELVDYNQQLEQFAFISAHNLRSPVARILGLGNVLEMSSRDQEEAKVIYQKMVASAKELDRVVRDLNMILEIKKNSSAIVSKISLKEEFDRACVYLEKEIEETRAVFIDDFSAAPEIESVKPYVESIFHNLISNAIKYRRPNVSPVVELRTHRTGNYICLEVSDNGLGFDTDLFKDKVFKLYQRFHDHVEGKGLGLYLVKTQIMAMGGFIEVSSQIDKGSCFQVYFKRS